MNFVYPRLPPGGHRTLMLAALLGALIAGTYGVLHDQVTYTLAPEYFTRFKYQQFGYENLQFPHRIIVAMIGFLATWWVGLICGWVLARAAFFRQSVAVPLGFIVKHFGIIITAAVVFGAAGYAYGAFTVTAAAPGHWTWWADAHGVTDIPAFARVGYAHNFGYAGAGIGLLVAAGGLLKQQIRRPVRNP